MQAEQEPKKPFEKPDLKSLNVKWGYSREVGGNRGLRSGAQYTRDENGSLRRVNPGAAQ